MGHNKRGGLIKNELFLLVIGEQLGRGRGISGYGKKTPVYEIRCHKSANDYEEKDLHLIFLFISFKTEFNPLQLGTRQYTNNSQLLIKLSKELLRLILVLVKE